MKELERKIKNRKVIALLAIILGWIPLAGWILIMYSVLSYYRLMSQIPDDRYVKDLRAIRIRGFVAMFLLPLELIVIGFVMILLGN